MAPVEQDPSKISRWKRVPWVVDKSAGSGRKMKTATFVMMVLALFLAGCGGGGGGVTAPVSVPPVGPDEIRCIYQSSCLIRVKLGAEAYLESLALEPASGNSRTIGGHEYTAVGEKGDISFGQAKAGPTDTLDIDFIGDHWNELPQELQGVLERGGKVWSYRLSSSPRGNRMGIYRLGAEPVS